MKILACSIASACSGDRQMRPNAIAATGCVLLALQAASAFSQTVVTPPTPATKPAEPTKLDRVDVTGKQLSDTDERRESTAAKIIVGRDEIEQFGDSNLSEIFKRLPGVTVQGGPRRGREIRMRGLGSGYTQILLDGERVSSRFSIDSISPEQIERIEILRAPTAETGARAIAGTINIITREATRKRINDLRLGAGFERSRVQPNVSWTRADSVGNVNYNLSLSAASEPRDSDSVTTTTDQRLTDDATTLAQREAAQTRERRQSLSLSSRLQWKGEGGNAVTLSPVFTHTDTHTRRESELLQDIGATPPLYRRSATEGDSRSTNARLSGRWRGRVDEDTRLELSTALRQSNGDSQSQRREFNDAGVASRLLDDRSDTRERRLTAAAKVSRTVADAHSLVAGIEAEAARRNETRSTSQNGAPILTDFGDNVAAKSSRLAAYLQDEWTISQHLSANAGLRWEGITTRGDSGLSNDNTSVKNRSSVTTPLLHAVWKPNANGRDQLRMSLTRSYRAPTLQNLIGRPSLSTRYPVPGANQPTSPDRVGNPTLLPELATGVDLAYEHYLDGGGLVSANLFRRNIRNLIRNVTTEEQVPWATAPRWVSRPTNVGNAVTQGLELEAKLRLNQLIADAAPVDLRANLSLFRSKVANVPGPNNRLDQQPRMTANLGADYRFRSAPLKVGANINWNPAYATQISETEATFQGRKTAVDAYALWTFNPSVQLRVSASNLLPIDYITTSSIDTDEVRETSKTISRSYINWNMRLEIKL